MKTYSGIITSLPPNGVFVFGSNTQGRHGKGAALIARKHFGAIYGQSYGFQGMSYGIITKNLSKKVNPSVPKGMIMAQIRALYQTASDSPQLDFYVAYGVTSNLNGYTPQDMADMFKDASITPIPENIIFNDEFANLINPK